MSEFYSISMFDFQSQRDAYMMMHGIKEDPDEIQDADGFDHLYSKLGENMAENPELWD